jgi:glycosyltransferase involved in cell wall biosynthesis
LTPRRRVLVVAGWYPSAEAPVDGIFVREHALAAARRHDVAVLVVEALGPEAPLLSRREGVEAGLRTVRVRHRALPGPAAGLLYVPGAAAALRALGAGGFRPEIIHAHVYAAGLLGVLLGRAWRVPVVVSEHFSGFQLGTLGAADRAMARAAFRGASTVAPVSESLRAAIAPLAPGARFRVVPNVVDTDLFGPPEQPRRGDGVQVLFCGLLDEIKGLGALLRGFAAARERRPDLRLDLVGGGPGRPRYEAQAAALGLGDAAVFHGPLPKPELAARMHAADFLVLPSRTETFGVVAAEAMACGLPVLATRVGALPEIVDERCGRLVASGDPAALAAGLLAMAGGHARYDRAAIAAEARRRFSPEVIADAWTAVYEEALG